VCQRGRNQVAAVAAAALTDDALRHWTFLVARPYRHGQLRHHPPPAAAAGINEDAAWKQSQQ